MKRTTEQDLYRVCSVAVVSLTSLMFASPYAFIVGYFVWRTLAAD